MQSDAISTSCNLFFFPLPIHLLCPCVITTQLQTPTDDESVTFSISLPTAKRPPVEETAAFLRTLLENHGANYLEKLFGAKARNALLPLGGPEKVAIALSGNFYSVTCTLAGREEDEGWPSVQNILPSFT